MSARTEVRGAAAVVTLDWPERRNSLGPGQAAELADALEAAGAEQDVAAVVLTGNGAFCAGGDLPAIVAMTRGGPDAVRAGVYGHFQRLVRTLLAVPLPTIAAVDGAAVGLGMDLALACDLRLCGPAGWMRQGWAKLGLVPGTGGVALLQRLAPAALWEVLSTDPKLDGPALERLGLARPAATTGVEAAVDVAASLARIGDRALLAYVDLSRPSPDEVDAHLARVLEHQVGLLCSPEFARRAEELLGG